MNIIFGAVELYELLIVEQESLSNIGTAMGYFISYKCNIGWRVRTLSTDRRQSISNITRRSGIIVKMLLRCQYHVNSIPIQTSTTH